MDAPVVIVGSGLAGYNLAREFRRLDSETPLLLLSRDHAGFYSKPMLSNALAGGRTAASLLMKSAATMAGELRATVRAGTSVQRIDADARTLQLDDGELLRWRDLVLALGADPIRLPLDGDGADAVLSVNDLDDLARFTERLQGARRVAILGAGLIGCEFANDLRARAIEPTLIDLADRPLARLLPDAAGLWMRRRLEAAGVVFRFGVAATRVERDGAAFALHLSDGSVVGADVVLSAVGLRPRTALAAAAGARVGRGIVVDRRLATSLPQVHAIGDCAEVEGHVLPFVLPLMAQARALAATLAGRPTDVRYAAMPVTVKTPASPAVVCPPPAGAAGRWSVDAGDEHCDARFTGADDALLGFALLGRATALKASLAAQVPELLPAP